MSAPSARFVSRLTRSTLALILAGGRGSRLKMLSDWRAKPAVPFGGKFRIVDFTLSNCLNSGILRISVLTQYKSHSLIRHIMEGWNSLRGEHGEFIELIPAQQWLEDDSWYQGTADAVYQSLDIVQSHDPELVLILAGDHIYKMDYGEMLGAHEEADADVTVACNQVPIESAGEFGVMEIDGDERIIGFEEKPEAPKPLPQDASLALVSMGIYVFDAEYLAEHLHRDSVVPDSSHDFGKDIVPYAVRNGHRVQAYPLNSRGCGADYWRDVGTIDAYYEANLELTKPNSPLDLYDSKWPIYTYQPQLPPAKFMHHGAEGGGRMNDSMASGGCVVENSAINNSLLFSNAKVGNRCHLDGVLVLPDCTIGRGSRLIRTILDNGCQVPPGTVIGENPELDASLYHRSEGGVVVVNRAMLGQERQYQPSMVFSS